MDENPSLNGLTTFGDINVSDLTADSATIGFLQANIIIANIQTYSTTTTNDITVNHSATIANLIVNETADFRNTVPPGYSITTSGSVIVGNRLNVRGSSVVTSGSITVGSNLFVTGNVTANNSLYVNGALTLNSSLNITGSIVANSSLEIYGAVSLYSTLNVVGNANFTNVSTNILTADTLNIQSLSELTVAGDLRVSGTATISSNLRIGGNTTIGSSLIVSGSSTFSSSLFISGVTQINNNLTINGNETINGNLTITGATTTQNVLTNTYGRTFIKNSNSGDYSLLDIQNNNNLGLACFINGSGRGTDGGANVATIRNDTSSTLRIQNNNEFSYGDGLKVPGDPTALCIDGSSANLQITALCAACDSELSHEFLYVGGYYSCNTPFLIKNLDGTLSGYSLPTSTNRKAYLIQYSAITGLVNLIWVSQDNTFSEVRNVYITTDRVYIVGVYRSSANSNIMDIGGNASAYTLPNSSSNFAGFAIGFYKTDFSYAVDRFTFINGASTATVGQFMSCIVEDQYGNVFISGSIVTAGVTTINNFLGVSSGVTIPSYATQTGFILRYDSNGNLTGRWHSTTSTYSWFVNDICIRQNELYMAVNVYNLGTTITIPHWQGAGSSLFTIYPSSAFSTAYFTACLISFTGISTIAAPTVTGRSLIANDNVSYSTYPNSSVCYDSANDNIYWAFPVISTQYVQYHTDMTNALFGANWVPPKGTNNAGLGTIIYKGTNKQIYGFPGFIWSNHTGSWSQTDGINLRLRYNPFNALVYFNFSIYSNQTPEFYGFYSVITNLQGFNNSYPNSFYNAYSLVLGLNVPRGLHYIPYSFNYSFASDTAFFNSDKMYTVHTISNNAGWNINNYDTYATSFNMPTGGAYNQQVILSMKTKHYHTNYFNYTGVGIGRNNNGALGCSLEVEKGILTNTYLMTKEIRNTGFTYPVRFSDSIGRELGKLVFAYVQLDAMRTFYVDLASASNIYYVDKQANGRYRCYFSQPAPHKNYSIFISSTSWASNNYTVFPFISSLAGANGYPNYKEVTGFEITTTNTAGTGFDLNQISVMVIV